MFRILIVDDSKAVHAFVKNLLSKSKEVSVTDVYDGLQAVELLKQNKNFDLILLDWEMPNMDGPTTFGHFVKMNLGIPTIMMTTKNAPEDISKMLNMGVSEYLLKPFTIDILFEKIEFVSGKALPYAAA